MPSLELRVPEAPPSATSTHLRTLLEKPNAVILRRNHLAQALVGDDPSLHSRLRVSAVLTVDITNPPRASEAGRDDSGEPDPEEHDEFGESFAKGIEISVARDKQTSLVLADFDELERALSLFDAYDRIARYQPAYLRLDQRTIGISYAFREGLVLGIAGDPKQLRENVEGFFDSATAHSEAEDSRTSRFTVRLPHSSIAYLHELFKSAAEWLNQNSYKNILGS